jgi:hypothetical protein
MTEIYIRKEEEREGMFFEYDGLVEGKAQP